MGLVPCRPHEEGDDGQFHHEDERPDAKNRKQFVHGLNLALAYGFINHFSESIRKPITPRRQRGDQLQTASTFANRILLLCSLRGFFASANSSTIES